MRMTNNQFNSITKAAKQALISRVITEEEYTDIIYCVCDIVKEICRTERKTVCEWSYDDDADVYKTECGELHVLNSGTPTNNNYMYCPYCGKRIVGSEE